LLECPGKALPRGRIIEVEKEPVDAKERETAHERLSLRQRLNVSRLALAYGGTTIGAWLLIGAGGLLAAWHLPVAMFPDIAFPVVIVVADAPGRAAGSVERELTVPVERRLLKLAARGPLMSTTTDGRAVATVQFEIGVDLKAAERQVRAALADLALPEGARLAIRRIDLNEAPVVTYVVAPRDPAGFAGAAEFAGRLALRLGTVAGVARVEPLDRDAGRAGLPPARIRLDGESAIALEVVKEAGANTLEVAQALERVVRDSEPGGELRIVPVRAEAPFIREATGSTLEALWAAVALSVLVIYPFLRSVPATAISALAIPSSPRRASWTASGR
jgi:multidrug efflux pump subunit AcrB